MKKILFSLALIASTIVAVDILAAKKTVKKKHVTKTKNTPKAAAAHEEQIDEDMHNENKSMTAIPQPTEEQLEALKKIEEEKKQERNKIFKKMSKKTCQTLLSLSHIEFAATLQGNGASQANIERMNKNIQNFTDEKFSENIKEFSDALYKELSDDQKNIAEQIFSQEERNFLKDLSEDKRKIENQKDFDSLEKFEQEAYAKMQQFNMMIGLDFLRLKVSYYKNLYEYVQENEPASLIKLFDNDGMLIPVTKRSEKVFSPTHVEELLNNFIINWMEQATQAANANQK